jgi:hypothetical protein
MRASVTPVRGAQTGLCPSDFRHDLRLEVELDSRVGAVRKSFGPSGPRIIAVAHGDVEKTVVLLLPVHSQAFAIHFVRHTINRIVTVWRR